MKLFARGNEAPAQVLGKGSCVPPHGIETLLLAQSIGVNSRLVFEVERDRAEYLGQSQSLELPQDRFGGKSFIEALDDGIERYASTCQIVSTVALFDVFFRHQPNYSWTSWLDAFCLWLPTMDCFCQADVSSSRDPKAAKYRHFREIENERENRSRQ